MRIHPFNLITEHKHGHHKCQNENWVFVLKDGNLHSQQNTNITTNLSNPNEIKPTKPSTNKGVVESSLFWSYTITSAYFISSWHA